MHRYRFSNFQRHLLFFPLLLKYLIIRLLRKKVLLGLTLVKSQNILNSITQDFDTYKKKKQEMFPWLTKITDVST